MPETLLPDAPLPPIPLQVMLEQRRLTHRDRRLAHVIGVLRSRADAHELPPRGLMLAITDFSREHSTVRRRLSELEAQGTLLD